MTSLLYDEKALKILFNAFWSSSGWSKRLPLPDDFAYAKNQRVMFDPCSLQHDEIVRSARAMSEEVGHRMVADAFLASLNTRELAYRSALGSFATSYQLPPHEFQEGKYRHICRVCGDYKEHTNEDLNVLNFERLKWGGVRHLHPGYAWFDLTQFRKLPPASPTTEDQKIFQRLLDVIASQPADARANDLEKAISKLFLSNKDERRTVLQILGYCGILQPNSHPSFFGGYANRDDRKQPDEHKNDWAFPVLWWRGCDGVNLKAVKFYFPNI